MKRMLTVHSILAISTAALVISLLLLRPVAQGQTDQDNRPSFVEGEMIVQLMTDDPISLTEDFASSNLLPARLLSQRLNIWLFEYDGAGMKSTEHIALLSELRAHHQVSLAQFNHHVTMRQTFPNDPSFGVQWGLHNVGQSGGRVDADIDAPEAWDITTGGITANGDQIVVAVIDGGCDLNHIDLDLFKNIHEIPGNGIDDDSNGYVDDYDGWNAYNHSGNVSNSAHGTHVSGIAGAVGNNGTGVSGVNWGVKVLPISGASNNEAIVVEAYGYVVEMRARYNETDGAMGAFVVSTNSSFGIDYGDPADSPIWCAMYDSMGVLGILSAAATANMNIDIDIELDVPTACPSDYLLAVTNTTRNDVKNSGAAYGKRTIDLGAPGTSILSTVTGNGYSYMTGTSMATPHVAGAVALLYAAASQYLLQQYKDDPATVAMLIKQYILDGTDPLSSLAGITVSGGRLNVYNSLQLMALQPPHPVVSFPSRNGLNVDAGADISVTFDLAMDEASITGSTFVVNASVTGRHSGTISYDSPTMTASFDTDNDFTVGEIVTVSLNTGIQSSSGLPLERNFVWSFTVQVTRGSGLFANYRDYAVGDSPHSIVVADFDGDADVDIATANTGSDDVSALLNNGDSTFAVYSTYQVSERPNSVCAADLDGDGDIDLATAHDTLDLVSVLLNDGGGAFAPFLTYSVGAEPVGVHAADLDGDGDLDLAVANAGDGSVSVLLNDGLGGFDPHSTYLVGDRPVAIASGDFDGDGDLDLVTANRDTSFVSVLLNNGDGTFAGVSTFPVEAGATSIVIADFDSDGEIDLAVAHPDSAKVSVLRNNGDGTFAAAVSYVVAEGPVAIIAGDLDGDGDLDLATASQSIDRVSVLLNDGTGAFGASSGFQTGNHPMSLGVADFDGDGGLELATANADANNVSILSNTCCMGEIRGNIDYDPNDIIEISDLVYVVDYMFNGGAEPVCWPEVNIDGSDADANAEDTASDIDIADLVYLVDYMFNGGPAPMACP